jgi:hypothetical protein
VAFNTTGAGGYGSPLDNFPPSSVGQASLNPGTAAKAVQIGNPSTDAGVAILRAVAPSIDAGRVSALSRKLNGRAVPSKPLRPTLELGTQVMPAPPGTAAARRVVSVESAIPHGRFLLGAVLVGVGAYKGWHLLTLAGGAIVFFAVQTAVKVAGADAPILG